MGLLGLKSFLLSERNDSSERAVIFLCVLVIF